MARRSIGWIVGLLSLYGVAAAESPPVYDVAIRGGTLYTGGFELGPVGDVATDLACGWPFAGDVHPRRFGTSPRKLRRSADDAGVVSIGVALDDGRPTGSRGGRALCASGDRAASTAAQHSR